MTAGNLHKHPIPIVTGPSKCQSMPVCNAEVAIEPQRASSTHRERMGTHPRKVETGEVPEHVMELVH